MDNYGPQKRVNIPSVDRKEVKREVKIRRKALEQFSDFSLCNSPLWSLF